MVLEEKFTMSRSCATCQASYLRDSGEIKSSLARLVEQGDEARQALEKLPVLAAEHADMKNHIKEHGSAILSLQIEQARGRGMLVVIGVIAGILATFLTNFFVARWGAK
jgi:hypothetical protein